MACDVPTSQEGDPDLIADLLVDQHRLSAVEQFAALHDRGGLNATRYRHLLPVRTPRAGEQLAFEVNLDQCSGCKACVTACHSMNGLDNGEAWREIGTLLSEDWRRPYQQTVTTACHHCVDPACLNGCPVLAYDKDPLTGIVRHLDDQCIGCQYCILKCPYDVPKYSEARGIVRKCDMCAQRLSVGESPACVQACPNEAIRITLVDVPALEAGYRSIAAESSGAAALTWLPASPDPAITLPTTRYVSRQLLSSALVPARPSALRLESPHWPLIWMLILTQLGTGAFCALCFTAAAQRPLLAVVAAAAIHLGLLASILHLGRPLKAWRSFLGLRKSWLSREIVVFGLFAALVAATTGLLWVPVSLHAVFLSVAGLVGLASVGCSGMVYHDTARPFWRGFRSCGRFLGTTAVLGLVTAWCVDAISTNAPSRWPWLLALAAFVKFAAECRFYRPADDEVGELIAPPPGQSEAWFLARSGAIMRDELGLVTRSRFAAALIGGILLPALSFLWPEPSAVFASMSLILCFGSELAERYSFFRAVVAPQFFRSA